MKRKSGDEETCILVSYSKSPDDNEGDCQRIRELEIIQENFHLGVVGHPGRAMETVSLQDSSPYETVKG